MKGKNGRGDRVATLDPFSWEIETWTTGFYSVYAVNDDNRTYSAIWLPVTSHASTVAEAVRLNNYDEVVYNLGNVLAWVLSFAERFRVDLTESEVGRNLMGIHGENWTEWILHKYPGACNICGASRCFCSSMRDVMELRHKEKKAEYDGFMEERGRRIKKAFLEMFPEKGAHKIMAMPELFDMFQRIYGGTLWGVPLADVSFHFLEEVGEVSKEIALLEAICGRHTRESWREKVSKEDPPIWKDSYSEVCIGITRELADVFSWTTALCFKVEQLSKQKWAPRGALVKLYIGEIPEGKARKSVNIYEDRYEFVCRYCGREKCSQGCVNNQIQKRIDEGVRERQRKFAYEIHDLASAPEPVQTTKG